MKNICLITLSLFCLQTKAQRIRTELISNHIAYLSSDELGGRATSSTEEKKAAAYIEDQFKGMRLIPKGTKGYSYDFTYKYNPNVHDTNTKAIKAKTGRNVIGFLDNGRAYTVVIGAHYDHLGYGHDHNSLDPNPENKIHNGADDNASGVAGVIELARNFSLNGVRENYNFLFMTFSGEELGLIGSKKWCEHPTYPLSNINYMINLDMIGRFEKDKNVLIYGVGTSPQWIQDIEAVHPSFPVKYDSAGIGPSDQTSFYLMNIPVLHFFTGQHSDYHKPTDDFNKINAVGETNILEMIIDLVYHMDGKDKLSFLKTKDTESRKTSFKITMGVMPDYVFDGIGMRIDGVTDGKPAAKAGLEQGDIILQIGDSEVSDVQGYMKILNTLNKGDLKKVIIERKGTRLEKEVQF
jgi:hypothetical protein